LASGSPTSVQAHGSADAVCFGKDDMHRIWSAFMFDFCSQHGCRPSNRWACNEQSERTVESSALRVLTCSRRFQELLTQRRQPGRRSEAEAPSETELVFFFYSFPSPSSMRLLLIGLCLFVLSTLAAPRSCFIKQGVGIPALLCSSVPS
jgi:hypothetical protein